MRSIIKFCFFSLFILFGNALFAQQIFRPFPQHVIYADGVIIPNHITRRQMDDSVQNFYTSWKERYVNDDAGAGAYYIWTENAVQKNICVSEGQGYGMIIVALMAGYDALAQKTYDGLFRYYKLHPSKEKSVLMAWAQNRSFKNIDETSAADGDMDIAYSLLLASAQWGNKGNINYFDEAQTLIAAISKEEINHLTWSVLLSNSIEPDSKDYFDTRSSDFMPAHFKIFEDVTKDSTWYKVIGSNYTLFNFLQKKYSPEAGIFPDFIQHINRLPVPAKPMYLESKYDGCYNYNACRSPWRIATDYIITGDIRSKQIIDKINTWIRETTQGNPDNISAGYTLQGDDLKSRNFEAMSFISSFAVAAMVDKKNQDWLNKLWNYITSFDIDQYDYYDNSIKMLELIILSGNYWAPKI
jgi:endo-1,4-beta-D-glucanase Y